MRKLLSVIFLLLLTFPVKKSYSQVGKDTILLLNGNTVISKVIDTTKGVTTFIDPKNPAETIVIENNRIFSIKNKKGEFILYVYDTLLGNEFTIDEMRYFIYGEQDAQKGFKARIAFCGNFLLSAGAGITGSFLSPLVPFTYTVLAGLPKVKIRKKTVSNPEYVKHDSYLMGYERVARKKLKLSSLIGGGIGLGAGLITSFILKQNHVELY